MIILSEGFYSLVTKCSKRSFKNMFLIFFREDLFSRTEAKSIFCGRNLREFLEKNRETAKIRPIKVSGLHEHLRNSAFKIDIKLPYDSISLKLRAPI